MDDVLACMLFGKMLIFELFKSDDIEVATRVVAMLEAGLLSDVEGVLVWSAVEFDDQIAFAELISEEWISLAGNWVLLSLVLSFYLRVQGG